MCPTRRAKVRLLDFLLSLFGFWDEEKVGEAFIVINSFGGWDLFEDLFKSLVGLDAVYFGGDDEAVKQGTRVSPSHGIRKEPIITSDREFPNGPFCKAIVYFQNSVLEIATKKIVLV